MRLENNGEQSVEKTTKKFPKNKDIDEKEVVIEGQTQLVEAEGFSIASPKLKIKNRYWLVLSRYTFNNKLKRHVVAAATMKQAVQDFLLGKDIGEEFLTITEIEPDALQAIASTL